MTIVTLVGRNMAKVGLEFIYSGPVPQCKECRIKTVCFNLRQGKRYRIISLRDKAHDCVINEDKAQIVEVEEIPSIMVLPKRLAIEGSTITFEQTFCREPGCKHYHDCRPYSMTDGTKIKVIKLKRKVTCAKGKDMVLVEVV